MHEEKGLPRIAILSDKQAVAMIRKGLSCALFIEAMASQLHHTDSFKSFKMDRVARAARDIIRDLESVL